MIFRQWQEILEGKKTQTRRLVREGDVYAHGDLLTGVSNILTDRWRWWIGQQLPIIPKRGQKAIRDEYGNIQRVAIVRLRQERLQDISEQDAQAEGIYLLTPPTWGWCYGDEYTFHTPIEAYEYLWGSINGKKGTRWDDNPLVWVIEFAIVKPLPAAAQ